MSFLKMMLYVLICATVGCLTWLTFWNFTPKLMELNWIWILLVYMFVAGIVISAIVYLPRKMSRLLVTIRSYTTFESGLVAAIILLFALSTVVDVWTIGFSYGAKEIIVGVAQTFMAIAVFVVLYKILSFTSIGRYKIG